jgi:hypothetical protein
MIDSSRQRKLDGTGDPFDGQITVPSRRVDQSKEMMGIGALRLGRQDLLIDLDRFVESAGLMMGNSRFQGFGD